MIESNQHIYYDSETEFIESQKVEDVNIKFIYQPHSLAALLSLLIGLVYFCFHRDEVQNTQNNYWNGLVASFVFFIVLSMLICPNGPFTRPHPIIWRIVLGISIFYTIGLIFILFQKYEDIRSAIFYLYPDLKNKPPDLKNYAVDCALTWDNVNDKMDVFILCHFFGWLIKAMLVRHSGILWLLSILWEITELGFQHLLPNFAECWWDSIVLDLLLCNGVGIYAGLYLCKKLEMRSYFWESVVSIKGTRRKLKRVVLQFTPMSWTPALWFDISSPVVRYIALCFLCIFWQISELNSFFLKHIFVIPTNHPLNFYRIVLILALTAPAVRQYYLYATHNKCYRLGTHAWIFIALTCTESLVCVRHGLSLFKQTRSIAIGLWFLVQLLAVLVVLFLMVWWNQHKKTKHYEKLPDRQKDSNSLKN